MTGGRRARCGWCCRLALKPFDDWWAASTLWLVWLAAAFGIGYQLKFHEQYKWLETLLYLMVGVLPAIVVISVVSPT